MKPLIIAGGESVVEAVRELKDGVVYKFVPLVYADFETEEIRLVLALGPVSREHINIASATCEYIKRSPDFKALHLVEMRPSGGRVMIGGDVLIFFDSSHKFGPFDPKLLGKMEKQSLLDLFGVKSVRYQE